ncbi:FkbM family methyltransferase [Thioalkalivibrio sulfidiphilus]|uniref:FkbM family methyltransferase n=1 Tax=Thioalkalivibrio sulfidiphilus TaxID=1033854 RepID=UPI003BAFEA1B
MIRLVTKARKLAAIVAMPAWRTALQRHRVAAGVEHARVLRNLGAVRTVVDIGANRGQFALVARHCFPDARIVSFEPLAGPAAVYRRVFEGDGCVTLVESAVGPQPGEAEIHLSRRDDSSSLLPITERQDELFPGTAEAGTARIRVVRLVDVLQAQEVTAPALLKLDVQGFELPALEGSEDLLPQFDWVYVECSFVELYAGQALANEVIAWLRERDFRLTGVFNMTYDRAGRAIQADFLFRKS